MGAAFQRALRHSGAPLAATLAVLAVLATAGPVLAAGRLDATLAEDVPPPSPTTSGGSEGPGPSSTTTALPTTTTTTTSTTSTTSTTAAAPGTSTTLLAPTSTTQTTMTGAGATTTSAPTSTTSPAPSPTTTLAPPGAAPSSTAPSSTAPSSRPPSSSAGTPASGTPAPASTLAPTGTVAPTSAEGPSVATTFPLGPPVNGQPQTGRPWPLASPATTAAGQLSTATSAAAATTTSVPATSETTPPTTAATTTLTTALPPRTPSSASRTQAAPVLRAVPVVSVPQSVREGQLVRISGQGFRPGTPVKVVLGPDDAHEQAAPAVVATAHTGAQGQFEASAVVPAMRPGTHKFQVVGVAASGHVTSLAARVVVLAASKQASGAPQLATPGLLALAIGLPLGTWLCLELLSRRRGQPGRRAAR